jgi:hypothetical protein
MKMPQEERALWNDKRVKVEDESNFGNNKSTLCPFLKKCVDVGGL